MDNKGETAIDANVPISCSKANAAFVWEFALDYWRNKYRRLKTSNYSTALQLLLRIDQNTSNIWYKFNKSYANLYSEKYETLLTEIQEDIIKWRYHVQGLYDSLVRYQFYPNSSVNSMQYQ